MVSAHITSATETTEEVVDRGDTKKKGWVRLGDQLYVRNEKREERVA